MDSSNVLVQTFWYHCHACRKDSQNLKLVNTLGADLLGITAVKQTCIEGAVNVRNYVRPILILICVVLAAAAYFALGNHVVALIFATCGVMLWAFLERGMPLR